MILIGRDTCSAVGRHHRPCRSLQENHCRIPSSGAEWRKPVGSRAPWADGKRGWRCSSMMVVGKWYRFRCIRRMPKEYKSGRSDRGSGRNSFGELQIRLYLTGSLAGMFMGLPPAAAAAVAARRQCDEHRDGEHLHLDSSFQLGDGPTEHKYSLRDA